MYYNRGEAVRIRARFYDENDNLVNPSTSVKLTIKDKNDTELVSAQDMTNQSTGRYFYIYPTSSNSILGKYSVKIDALDHSYHSIEYDSFDLGE